MPQSMQDAIDERFWKNPFRNSAESLHLYFLFLSVPLVIFLSFWNPPFMTPDEPWHFARAFQIAGGTFQSGDGGYLDKGILQLWNEISKEQVPSNVHYSAQIRVRAESIRWTGDMVFKEFANIAQYPSFGYLPQAIGIIVGKMIGVGVARTLAIARLCNGLTAILICTFALFWCRAGRLFMFTILLLPMSLSLFASASQDSSLISLTALAFAIISRQIAEKKTLSRGKVIILLALFLAISLGKPPYAALTLVLFIPGLMPRWGKRPAWLTAVSLIATNVLVVVAWWLFTLSRMKHFVDLHPNSGHYSASPQLLNLMRNPEIILKLINFLLTTSVATLSSVIGLVGWRDTMVPLLYYPAMMLVLLIAAIAELAGYERSGRCSHLLVFASSTIAAFAIYLIAYLLWSPLGATVIYNVQGRYMLPLAVALGLGLHGHRPSPTTYTRLTAIVISSQILTCVCLPYSIYVRFYSY